MEKRHSTAVVWTKSKLVVYLRKFGGTPGFSGRGYSTYLTYKQGNRIYKRDIVNTNDIAYTTLTSASYITSDPSNRQIYYYSGNSINSSPVGNSGKVFVMDSKYA